MDKQRGSITIIIVALLLLVVVIGVGFYFLSPMLLNTSPKVTPIIVNQNPVLPKPTVITPTPTSTDSSQLVPPITSQTDLDKVSTDLDGTTFAGVDSDMSQLNSDASSF